MINISNPENPHIVGSVDTPWNAVDVAVAGIYAYVVDWEGLRVIDISIPEDPQIAGAVGAALIAAEKAGVPD